MNSSRELIFAISAKVDLSSRLDHLTGNDDDDVVSRVKKGMGGRKRGRERKARWSAFSFSRLARYTRKNSAAKVKGERRLLLLVFELLPLPRPVSFVCATFARPRITGQGSYQSFFYFHHRP